MNVKNLSFGMFFLVLGCFSQAQAQEAVGLHQINHIIILYQENWSFD
jgi:phospholipase C